MPFTYGCEVQSSQIIRNPLRAQDAPGRSFHTRADERFMVIRHYRRCLHREKIRSPPLVPIVRQFRTTVSERRREIIIPFTMLIRDE